MQLPSKRQSLYELVWSKPAHEIVANLQISEQTLIARCVELQIPRPLEGYWRAVAKGAAPAVPALPSFKHNESINPRKQPDLPPANEEQGEQPLPSGSKPASKGKPKSSTRFIQGRSCFPLPKRFYLTLRLLSWAITSRQSANYSMLTFPTLV